MYEQLYFRESFYEKFLLLLNQIFPNFSVAYVIYYDTNQIFSHVYSSIQPDLIVGEERATP